MNARATICSMLEHAGGIGGKADLAVRWGVSKTRVQQLVGEESFPEPVTWVNSRAVYALEECDRWRESRLEGLSERVRDGGRSSAPGAGDGSSSRPVSGDGRSASVAKVQSTARDEDEDW